MKWSKSPPELIAAFDEVLPGPPVERKLMFGYPAGFVNGNMFCGLYQDSMVIKLDEPARTKLLKLKGTKTFEPMPGRPMKEYVQIPSSLVPRCEPWLEESLGYVSKLPPKKKKPKKKK